MALGRSAGANADEHDHGHPERDRDVGDVEGRPKRRVEEVGDRAEANPVDEIADRAADEQADAEPQPGPRGVDREPAEISASATAGEREHERVAALVEQAEGDRRCWSPG